MTIDHAILGAPPPAPTPTAAPCQEDRLLAAVAYLGYFTGLWLIVPIAVYVLRRDRSRFVAHHALRAVLLHVLAIPVFLASWTLGLAVTFGVAAMESEGWSGGGVGDLALMVLSLFGWIAPWLLYLVICTLVTVGALRGRVNTRSVFGRLVERLLGAEQAAAASAQPGA